MLKIKKISEVLGKHAYTSEGEYFGQVEEASLGENKIEGWKIRIAGGMSNFFAGARGVIIPHSFVKAIGDVFIITKAQLPNKEEPASQFELEENIQ